MSKLTIKGSKRYTRYMKKHLGEEHPKTRGRMKRRNGSTKT